MIMKYTHGPSASDPIVGIAHMMIPTIVLELFRSPFHFSLV